MVQDHTTAEWRTDLRTVILKAREVSKEKWCLNYGSGSRVGGEAGDRYRRYC